MSDSKITNATPEQWKRIDEIRERWLAEQTRNVNLDDVTGAVRALYAMDGETDCSVFLVDGPYAVAMVTLLLQGMEDVVKEVSGAFYTKNKNKNILRRDIAEYAESVIRDMIYSQVSNQFDDMSDDNERADKLLKEYASHRGVVVNSSIKSLTTAQLSELDKIIESNLNDTLTKNMNNQWVCIWWQVAAAWYEGATELGVEFDKEKLTVLTNWAKNVPLGRFFDKAAIVSRWPTEVHWQEGLMHCETGPAVAFRDGFKLWTISGIPVDEQIVLAPETQTIEQIDNEQNGDVRSIRIERFGWPRYLKDSGSVCEHRRRNDVDGTSEALYGTKLGQKRLVVTCPTGRMFALGVPDSITTCEQAQVWLGGNSKRNIIAAT